VVFLGSPQCVNVVLQALWDGANTCAVPFDLCAVVSQPPKPVKNKKDVKTPIHQLAEAIGVDHIMTPDSAKDESFLDALEELAPDVCITAAYGQYLPKRFLRTPKLGTLNLHPSLLPKWRGASPVQRCLEAGEDETGITILYTVTKMDAGPLVVQESTPLTGSETSEEMLDRLFAWGSELLLADALPRVLRGDVDMESARTQDEDAVTKASLIRKEEGNLWPHNETAVQMRNKVRAFTGWPGTTLPVAIAMKGETKGVRMRVSGAEVVSAAELPETSDGEERSPQALVFMPSKGAVAVRPGSDPDNVLLLKTLQIPSKSEMAATTFAKGYMKATQVLWMTPEEEAERATASKKGSGKKKQKKTRR
jgi:methionyl-tRNA formyltransferase